MSKTQSQVLEGVQWPQVTDQTGKTARSSTQTASKIIAASIDAHGFSESSEKVAELQNISGGKWRFGYQKYLTYLTRIMAESDTQKVVQIAEAGLKAAEEQFEFIAQDGQVLKMNMCRNIYSLVKNPFKTGTVQGSCKGQATTSVRVPFEKKDVEQIPELLLKFVNHGDMDKSVHNSIQNALTKPYYEDLSDLYFVLLGATSEMGPLKFLLDRGANVIAIARGGKSKWAQLIEHAKKSRGTLIFPLKSEGNPDASEDDLANFAGADALSQVPQIAQWLCQLLPDKTFYIASLIYLDGEKYVRASVAMDAIIDIVTSKRQQSTGLIYIDTPSSVNLVSKDCAEKAKAIFKEAPFWQKFFLTVGILKKQRFQEVPQQKNHVLLDCLAEFQGPNYAVAKMLQRFRAIVARSKNNQFVSNNMGPPALTESVLHAPAVAKVAPYMPLFRPNKMYHPDTASTVLALEMIADIRNTDSLSHPSTALEHPLHLMSDQAWHGGGWNSPFNADSTGVAAYICYAARKFAPIIGLTLAFAAYFRQPIFKFIGVTWPYMAALGVVFILYKKLMGRKR